MIKVVARWSRTWSKMIVGWGRLRSWYETELKLNWSRVGVGFRWSKGRTVVG